MWGERSEYYIRGLSILLDQFGNCGMHSGISHNWNWNAFYRLEPECGIGMHSSSIREEEEYKTLYTPFLLPLSPNFEKLFSNLINKTSFFFFAWSKIREYHNFGIEEYIPKLWNADLECVQFLSQDIRTGMFPCLSLLWTWWYDIQVATLLMV